VFTITSLTIFMNCMMNIWWLISDDEWWTVLRTKLSNTRRSWQLWENIEIHRDSSKSWILRCPQKICGLSYSILKANAPPPKAADAKAIYCVWNIEAIYWWCLWQLPLKPEGTVFSGCLSIHACMHDGDCLHDIWKDGALSNQLSECVQ